MNYKKSFEKSEKEYHIKNEFWSIMMMIYRLQKRIVENTYTIHNFYIMILYHHLQFYNFLF